MNHQRWVDDIESKADAAQKAFVKLTGRPIRGPSDVELCAELVYDLRILWWYMAEKPGQFIQGGLIPKEKLIVLNEKHLDYFKSHPGGVSFTIAHEMGHWQAQFQAQEVDEPTLFPMDECAVVAANHFWVDRRASVAAGADVAAMSSIVTEADKPHVRRVVNRFAEALLMPQEEVRAMMRTVEKVSSWMRVATLARWFRVGPTTMCIRLGHLGWSYVRRGDDFELADAASGQTFFDFGSAA